MLVVISAVVLFANRGAFAQTTENTTKTRPAKLENTTLQNRGELKERAIEVRCENRATRIQNKINMFGRSQQFHEEKYERLYERLSQLATRLNEKGVDVSKLKSDLATLREKIDVVNQKHAELITALENLKALECEDTDGLNNSLSEVKDILTEVRKATQDVKDFMVNTIKKDLADLRDDMQSLKENRKELERPNTSNKPAAN